MSLTTDIKPNPAHLDKGDFTLARVAVDVPDGHLSVVFDPALAAQDVVDAGRHFVPLVVVAEPAGSARAHTHTIRHSLSTGR